MLAQSTRRKMLSSCVKSSPGWLLFALLTSVDVSESIVIKTQNGLIRGKTGYTVDRNRTYYAFQGIPYAKPPVGNLRFQSPQPVEYWDGVLTTDTDAPRCVQTNKEQILGKEDCLYLNVYTPQLPDITKPLLPVMVWIYGGGFEAGTSEYNDTAPDYLLDQDVIFVSFNYRLGIFGFLSLGDTTVPGNNGLKDQNLALLWIKQNIINFGGDMDQITLFGQSAGSASVSYHLLAPHSRGLFNKVIMQSGTSFCLWAFSRSGPEVAKDLAKDLNISTNSSWDILSGLRNVEAYHLQKKAKDAQNAKYLKSDPKDGFIFAPVIEPDHPDAFLNNRSYELMQTGNYFKVTALLGYNSLEGWTQVSSLFRVYLVKFDLTPSYLVPIDMNIVDPDVKNSVGKKIKYQYFGLMPVSLSTKDLMLYISDDQFVRPIQKFAKLLAQHSPTYLYKFHYQGSLGGVSNRTSTGVAHAEELGYLFRRDNIKATASDELTRSRMIKLWTNFAKYGDPTPENDQLLQNQRWPPIYPNSTINSFNIDGNLSLTSNPDENAVMFWDKLYAKYGHPPYDTY
ncbi:juvenile hormone esterase-like [Coccinella septempunctata]|uniref:juvenile hormone esterase-like n=1 Tax=Coccinella septempunctata TaxID=41139 RepID=UPI001D0881AB|nr:juvenile hormone esterase-like [Coccinella septempunctata]